VSANVSRDAITKSKEEFLDFARFMSEH